MDRNVLGKSAFGTGIKAACVVAGLATFGLADNPISTYHYLADPAAAADSNYFYIITDSDDPAAYNAKTYEIKALYAFRSKDMQNWTDLGIIYDARVVSGIEDIWASGIAVYNKTFYIVFPDGGGGGIGYIKASAIDGPWENAVGENKDKLIGDWGRGIIDCDGVAWCFDPGIFIDDDGSAYVTWGGGEDADHPNRPNTDNFDIVKLNDAKNAPVGTGSHVVVKNLPVRKMLEASYIHKHKNKYYFSYSTGWQDGAPTIDYAMSDYVTGPYEWKGTILGDPTVSGVNVNGNNNHHGIAEFKGHSYAVYHDRRIAKGYKGLEIIPADDGREKPTEGYHRSVSIDEMFYNNDGTIKSVTFTDEGPQQIENFDPYDWYPALTSSKQKGIRSRSNFVQGQKANHVLLPLSSKESWIRISGVDFGEAATGFTVEAASTTDNNTIEIRTGSANGALAGTCTIRKTANKSTFAENKCDVEGLSGIVDYVFLVFKGKQDSTMAVKAWGFEGSGTTPPTPQSAFGGKVWAIPGKIEAEDFDIPGTGRGEEPESYNDKDSENHSCTDEDKVAECSEYRNGTGVDIYKKADGKVVVGHNQEGEWLEYTVNVEKAGDYTMFASVATNNVDAGFSLSLDGETLVEKVDSISTGSFDEFNFVQRNVHFDEAGQHVLRITVTGSWFDIDHITFVPGVDAEYTTEFDSKNSSGSSDSSTTFISGRALNFGSTEAETIYDVFDLHGNKVASFTAKNRTEAIRLWQGGSVECARVPKGINLIRNRSNGITVRVKIVR